jgi:hypothetical protein
LRTDRARAALAGTAVPRRTCQVRCRACACRGTTTRHAPPGRVATP